MHAEGFNESTGQGHLQNCLELVIWGTGCLIIWRARLLGLVTVTSECMCRFRALRYADITLDGGTVGFLRGV